MSRGTNCIIGLKILPALLVRACFNNSKMFPSYWPKSLMFPFSLFNLPKKDLLFKGIAISLQESSTTILEYNVSVHSNCCMPIKLTSKHFDITYIHFIFHILMHIKYILYKHTCIQYKHHATWYTYMCMHIYTYMINYYSSSTHNIGNRMKIMYLRSSGLRNSVFPFPWVNYIVLTIYIDPISFPIAPLGSTQLRLKITTELWALWRNMKIINLVRSNGPWATSLPFRVAYSYFQIDFPKLVPDSQGTSTIITTAFHFEQ